MATVIAPILSSLLTAIVLRLNIIPLWSFKVPLNILLLKVTFSITISPPTTLLVLELVLLPRLLDYLGLLPRLLEILPAVKTSLLTLWLLELVAAIEIPLLTVSLFLLLLHFPVPIEELPVIIELPSLLNALLVIIPVTIFLLSLLVIKSPIFRTPVPGKTFVSTAVKMLYPRWSKPAFVSTLNIRAIKSYFIIPEFCPAWPIRLTDDGRPDPFMCKPFHIHAARASHKYTVIPMIVI